ncbi:Lipid/polyisoprenoid-binding, YceI-like protein [mine drainage metagenome]|uniref:Lipid/polyisoprenoid-binding, YceI-like protein n=1 Tax=mine drainage metagenome TaxID=410659 RepID=T1C6I5_9ZZZZ
MSRFLTRNLLQIVALAIFTAATGHARTLWHSVAQGSNLTIIARWESTPVPGQFKIFHVQLAMVHAVPRLLNVKVDIRSLQFRSPLLAHAARSRVWFDMRRFVQARFSSMRFKKTGTNGGYQALGVLELKGVSHPVSIRFHLIPAGPKQLELAGKANVTRTDFDIGTGSWRTNSVIGMRVAIQFHVRLVQSP